MLGMLILARHIPFTSDENHYLAAGMALREEFKFVPTHTVLQGPLTFYANQIAGWFGASYDFPYEVTAGNRFRGRVGMLVFTAITLLLLLRLAWRHLGPRASVAAGLCYALNPIVLGHGCLMTPDMALTAGFMVTVVVGIHYLTKPSWRRAIPVGICLGIALATKYFALILLPVLAVAVAFGLLWRRDPRKFLSTLYDGAVCAAFALVTLHACYGFQAGFYDPVATPPRAGGPIYQIFGLADAARLLPDPFVRGVDLQMQTGRQLDKVLFLGEVTTARPSYYVVALLTKLPLAFLVLFVFSVFTWRPVRRLPGPVAWMISSGVFITLFYLSYLAKLQIGVRYILPLIPLLILFAVRCVDGIWKSFLGRLLLSGLALWAASVVFMGWPHYISWFNPAAGTRPYMLYGDSTSAWQLNPAKDPALRALKTRYPRAERVHTKSGPRLGGIILYALDVWPSYDLKPGQINHWLRDLEPADREGPFYYFVVTEDHFRLGKHSADKAAARRSRRDLAVALLAEEKLMEVDEVLRSGDDLPVVRRMRELLRADPRDHRSLIAGWNELGRYDLILANPHATPTDRGKAYFSRAEYKDCRRVFEAEMRERQLTTDELIVLCWAQIRDRAIKRVIQTLRDHPPPLGTQAYVRYNEQMKDLKDKWREYEILMQQIGGGRIPN